MGGHTRNQPIVAALCLLALACAAQVAARGQPPAGAAPEIRLPTAENGFRFAVIGDSGTGGRAQYTIGRLLAQCRKAFPFDTVLMLGDNLYGSEDAEDYEEKFARPYKELLDGGVKFHAALGNHDEPNQRFYKPFNMKESRYYTFQPADRLRFFAIDSTYANEEQLKWLEKELRESESDWKICFFHHPIYSSGRRHGSDVELREVLEPLFMKYGVDVVFSGHEHFYERLKPQNGIAYFISGAAGKLRSGNIGRSELTSKGFDRDFSFMLLEIAGDEMFFQTISLSGQTVDQGVIRRREAARPGGNNAVSRRVSGRAKKASR